MHTKYELNLTTYLEEEGNYIHLQVIRNIALAPPWGLNPWPQGHEFYNFGRPHYADYYGICHLSLMIAGVEKKIFENWSF